MGGVRVPGGGDTAGLGLGGSERWLCSLGAGVPTGAHSRSCDASGGTARDLRGWGGKVVQHVPPPGILCPECSQFKQVTREIHARCRRQGMWQPLFVADTHCCKFADSLHWWGTARTHSCNFASGPLLHSSALWRGAPLPQGPCFTVWDSASSSGSWLLSWGSSSCVRIHLCSWWPVLPCGPQALREVL